MLPKRWYAVACIDTDTITYIGTSELFTAVALVPGTCYVSADDAAKAIAFVRMECQRFRDTGWLPLGKIKRTRPVPKAKLERITQWNRS